METDHFCLTWKDHIGRFKSAFGEFLQNQIFSDVTLVSEKETFKVHQFVLSTCSPYFKNILIGVTAGQYPVIFLNGVTPRQVKWLLQYMYTGEVAVPADAVECFLNMGELLGIEGLCKSESDDDGHSSPETFITSAESVVEFNTNNVKPSSIAVGSSPKKNISTTLTHKRTIEKSSQQNNQLQTAAKKTKVCSPTKSQSAKPHSPVIQEDLNRSSIPRENEIQPIGTCDISNILNSPPRSPSLIFNMDHSDASALTALHDNSDQSVILQCENYEEIIEISDDDSKNEDTSTLQEFNKIVDVTVEPLPFQEYATLSSQNVVPRSLHEPSLNVQPSEVQSDDSDNSEIIVRRAPFSVIRRVDDNDSSSSESLANIPEVNKNKELKVVLRKWLGEPNNSEENASASVAYVNASDKQVPQTNINKLSPKNNLRKISEDVQTAVVVNEKRTKSCAVVSPRRLQDRKI